MSDIKELADKVEQATKSLHDERERFEDLSTLDICPLSDSSLGRKVRKMNLSKPSELDHVFVGS